jgi:hypothetical protein
MIAGHFNKGMGLGNMLAQYIMTRVIAMDKGYSWGMLEPENFKGNHFFNLDMGEEVIFPEADKGYPYPTPERINEAIKQQFIERKETHPDGSDIRGYDERVKDIPDNTIIHGIFQGEDYFKHHKDKIRNWLAVQPIEDMRDDVCIISFRGGEYRAFPENLYLPQIYWDRAVARMREINPKMLFEVRTDDPEEAQRFFPHFPVSNMMSEDWRKIRYAKYLILSNSSFSILPAFLNEDVKYIIAPWGHARHNLGYWGLRQNIMKGWNYQKLDGTYEIFN